MNISWLVAAVLTVALAGCPKSEALPPPAPALAPKSGFPALAPIPQTPLLGTPPNPTKFSFVVAGDNRPKKKNNLQPEPVAHEIFKAVKAGGYAFALWSGDIILGKDPTNQDLIGQEYAEFFQMASKARAPVFLAPGNHEMDDANDVANATMHAWYRQFVKVADYGAFNYGNSRFVALDTEEVPEGGAPDGGGGAAPAGDDDDDESSAGHVGKAQRAALQNDLELYKNNSSIQHIFVFMHHPIKPSAAKHGLQPTEAADLAALFAQYPKVHYVVAAHEHLYYNPLAPAFDPPSLTSPSSAKYPPPYYLVSGGAGAPNKTAPQHHYLTFAVDGATVTVTRIDLP